MLTDRYGNGLSTPSQAARDAYNDALDRFLAADVGVTAAFQSAIDADEGFALPYLGLARDHQMNGRMADVAEPLAKARALVISASERERSQVHVIGLLLEGKAAEARAAVREHLATYPRDAMVAQTCMGTFGLIGFSGEPGREAEQLAFTTSLAPHFGDDWWFLAQHGFAQLEVGRLDEAERNLEASIAGNPQNANAAHIRAHLYYENGESAAGLDFLDRWRTDYARGGLLQCHVSWHVAIWALEQGDAKRMWSVIDTEVAPDSGAGPPLNVLTDTAAILFRAELAGLPVDTNRWRKLSTYAARQFPNPGLAFADVHAALTYAMAGDGVALDRVMSGARGPAADVVVHLAEGFGAMAAGRWDEAVAALRGTIGDHARIGGSRAQRDLVEFAYAASLARSGHREEARRFLGLSRAHTRPDNAVRDLM